MDTPDDGIRLTIRIPASVHERVTASAEQQDRSLNQQIVAELRAGPPKPQPAGWGSDELGKTIEKARWQAYSTYARAPEYWAKLDLIHRLFEAAGHGFTDPDHVISAFLLARSHAAFLGAAQLAINTQAGEVSAMVRACLEAALYAADFADHPDHEEIWLNRNDSAEARKAARSQISPGGMIKDLRACAPLLGEPVSRLYELAVDTGAHPNVDAVFGNMRMDVNPSGDHVFTNVILAGDDLTIGAGLKNAARGGVAALLILERVFPERFAAAGVSEGLDQARQGL